MLPLVLLTGCALTPEMWTLSFSRSASLPIVAGVVQTNDTNQLLVSYSLPQVNVLRSDKQFCVFLPMDQQGHTPYPFEYVGRERTLNDLVKDLPAKQLDDVRNSQFSLVTMSWAVLQVESEAFTPINASRNGVKSDTGRHLQDAGVALVPYWVGERPGKVSEIYNRVGGKIYFDLQFPDESHVLLLPSEVRRPGGEYTRSVAVGIIKTPFYMMADVFFIPWVLIKGDNL